MERADFKITTPRWVINESICRYEFASRFVTGRVVVDAACGSGYGAKILLKNQPKKIFAFDISKDSIKRIKRKYQGINKNQVKFQVADVLNLPLKNQAVDVFVSLETIEHLNKVNKYLDEVKRVLKNDGFFICSTPNRRVTNPGLGFRGRPFNPFHLFEFSRKEFIQRLKNNFMSVELYGQNLYSDKKVKQFENLAFKTSSQIAIKLRQVFKLYHLFYDLKKWHRVRIIKDKKEPEYLIAVCRHPF